MKRLYPFRWPLAAALMAAWLMSACSVHEWPKDEFDDVNYIIDLNFNTEFPLYQEVYYSRTDEDYSDSRTPSVADHDVLYIIGLFPAGEKSNEAMYRQFTFTAPTDSDLDKTFTVAIPEGKWDLYVWTDFVDAGSFSDKYYNTGDLGAIVYADRDNYSGSNHCREVFRGTASIEVVHPYRYMEDEPLPAYRTVVPMRRPVGRFDFISTDVDEFVRQLSALSSRSRPQPIDAKSLSRADLEEFRVVFRYNAFMPSVYNVFTDKPTDSWTGMSFESSMDISDEGILMGFDHVLVNGSETIVNVSVEVYNGDGDMIASSPSLEVPVVRNKYTTVKGEFLTSNGSGGVSVSPGFDGDYNIEIK